MGKESSAVSHTMVRSLRYSESSGGNCGGQKQAGFLTLIAEARAVLVVKS